MTNTVSMTVNGKAVSAEVEPRTLLVQFLREHLGLTGTHVGCDTSQCGACVVHVDGNSVKSCTMLAVQADGAQVTTIEGLANGNDLHPMQAAFREHHGLQCGFCTPGMVMSAVDLAKQRQESDRAPDPRMARGQHLPLHRLSQHRQGDQSRGDRHAGGQDMTADGIGAPVRRKEDLRFLTGRGNYTDDMNRPGQLHAYLLRSPHAHAEIAGIDIAKAKQAPGVVAIYHRRRSGRRQGGRPALRLGRQEQGRLADGGAAAPRAGARARAPCRRPRRRRDRRDPQPGEGRLGADRGRLQDAARGDRGQRRDQVSQAADLGCGQEQHLLRLAYRRQGCRSTPPSRRRRM